MKQKTFSFFFCRKLPFHTIKHHIMSDGNYNRNLLPYRQYQSGVKAGRAQMHTLALRAFKTWMTEQGFSESELHDNELRFRELLNTAPSSSDPTP